AGQPTTCARTYEVQAGDTCNGISAANNVSTYQLAALNSGIDSSCSNLSVGETLCLGLSEGDCQATYVVQSGDSCWAIATSYGIDTDTLLSNNPQVNSACSNIYPGEVLCVSSEKLVTPTGGSTSTSASTSESSTTSSTTTTSASETTTSTSSSSSASATTTPAPDSTGSGKHNGGKHNHHGGHKDDDKDKKHDKDDDEDSGECRSVKHHRRRMERRVF
ncbi:hypothetical protein FRB90_003690, partial [Tulasnella sp. 427]